MCFAEPDPEPFKALPRVLLACLSGLLESTGKVSPCFSVKGDEIYVPSHFLFVEVLCSAKTPSGYEETFVFLWPNLRSSPLKVVVDQEASVIVGFQPVVEVDLVQIGRYQFFAEFVSFRT
jgi:hypothetical protein